MLSTCVSCFRVFKRPILAAIKHVECHTSSSTSDNPAVTSQNIIKQMFGISCCHHVSYPSSHAMRKGHEKWLNYLPNSREYITNNKEAKYFWNNWSYSSKGIQFLNFSFTLSPVLEDNSFKLGNKNGFQTRDALTLKLWYIWLADKYFHGLNFLLYFLSK